MAHREDQRAGPQGVRIAREGRRHAGPGGPHHRDIALGVTTNHLARHGAAIGRHDSRLGGCDDVRTGHEQVA